MFGEQLDTFILRLISHDRNIMTEEEIEEKELRECNSYVLQDNEFLKVTAAARDAFDWRSKDILDVGCGKGDLVNCLAKNGASEVWGIDIQDQHINIAKSVAGRERLDNAKFISGDFLKWNTEKRFDYILSYEVLDHIRDVKVTLEKMASLLKEDGKILNFAAGFWRGPAADHCDDFMKFFIPWRHVIFNEQALLNVRKEKFRPTDPGDSFENIRVGLSKYTLSSYKNAIHHAQLYPLRFVPNYQAKYRFKGIFHPISYLLTHAPFVGEIFTMSTFAVLESRRRA